MAASPSPPAIRTRRRGRALVFAALTLVLTLAPAGAVLTEPDVSYAAIIAGIAFLGAAPLAWAVVRIPPTLRRWRLPRRGVTTTARVLDERGGRLTYVYRDEQGGEREFRTVWTLASGTTREVSFDPREPAVVVGADGQGRWVGLLPILFAAVFGLCAYAVAVAAAIAVFSD